MTMEIGSNVRAIVLTGRQNAGDILRTGKRGFDRLAFDRGTKNKGSPRMTNNQGRSVRVPFLGKRASRYIIFRARKSLIAE